MQMEALLLPPDNSNTITGSWSAEKNSVVTAVLFRFSFH